MAFSKMDLLILLLLEEEEDDQDMMDILMCNNEIQPMFRQREEEGTYRLLTLKHLVDNDTKFREYFRLSPNVFEEVLKYLVPDLSRRSYNRHKVPITPRAKFSLTLRYLATGESFRSLSFQFRICRQHISRIVKDVLLSIRKNMLHLYLPEPTAQLWLENAKKFSTLWNFPNAIGALDGKHVRIVNPKMNGSLFDKSKNFSVVLLTIVDAEYKFVAVDVGAYGKESDSQIFGKSTFGKKLKANKFKIPPPASVGKDRSLPHILLGNEAFALDLNIMKPFSPKSSKADANKSMFNDRLCQGRKTTDNAFGILCRLFRVFTQPIAVEINTTVDVIVSSCILHNLLREEEMRVHGTVSATDEDLVPELPKENLIPLQPTLSRHHSHEAENVRHQFMEYFCSDESSVSCRGVTETFEPLDKNQQCAPSSYFSNI